MVNIEVCSPEHNSYYSSSCRFFYLMSRGTHVYQSVCCVCLRSGFVIIFCLFVLISTSVSLGLLLIVVLVLPLLVLLVVLPVLHCVVVVVVVAVDVMNVVRCGSKDGCDDVGVDATGPR